MKMLQEKLANLWENLKNCVEELANQKIKQKKMKTKIRGWKGNW